jgi:pyruvate kinase
MVLPFALSSQSTTNRYLVCGAESASLYLQVTSVDAEKGEVACVAQNEAVLEGLLTVFHVERSSHELCNVQNNLPILR